MNRYRQCLEVDVGAAAVTFPAPHGTDVVVVGEGETVTFGRAGSCDIRFGFVPTADVGVPRVAGRLIAAAASSTPRGC